MYREEEVVGLKTCAEKKKEKALNPEEEEVVHRKIYRWQHLCQPSCLMTSQLTANLQCVNM